MIERKIVSGVILDHKLEEFIRRNTNNAVIKKVEFSKNSLGEEILIHTPTPGFIIGREGSSIKKLTKDITGEFGFKSPKIKIAEVKQPYLSASCVAKFISNDLARFGQQRFKGVAFRALKSTMGVGAMGIEIRITGKIPSSRSKSWRFAQGYMKKTGYVSDYLIDIAKESVTLKTGVVGIKVMIMQPNTPLPDKIEYTSDIEEEVLKAEEEKKEIIEKEEKESKNKDKKE